MESENALRVLILLIAQLQRQAVIRKKGHRQFHLQHPQDGRLVKAFCKHSQAWLQKVSHGRVPIKQALLQKCALLYQHALPQPGPEKGQRERLKDPGPMVPQHGPPPG